MKLYKDFDNHVIKIYKADKFIGYVKLYRILRTGLYCFEKTKNVDDAMTYLSSTQCDNLKNKLSTKRDMLRYGVSYKFENIIVTAQEIRLSKLNVLKTKKIKTGLFKNKE